MFRGLSLVVVLGQWSVVSGQWQEYVWQEYLIRIRISSHIFLSIMFLSPIFSPSFFSEVGRELFQGGSAFGTLGFRGQSNAGSDETVIWSECSR
jgi:hypothetical protein